jgi:hypothetical protein
VRSIAVVALLAASTTAARADATRAWAAARVNLPARAEMVIGIDLPAILAGRMMGALGGAFGKGADDAARTCKIDAATALEGIVVASSGTSSNDGAAYLAFGSVDRAKIAACPALIAAVLNLPPDRLRIRTRGDVMDIDAGDTHTYVGWLDDRLAVIATEHDEAALKRWIGNKGVFASTPLARRINKLDTRVTIWAAASFHPSHHATQTTGDRTTGDIAVSGFYGSFVQTGHQVAVDIRVTTDGKRDAAALAARMRDSGGQTDLAITTALDEVVVKGAVSEERVLDVIARVLGVLGT